MKYPMLIFDWDGTIVNSIKKIIHIMKESAREMGLPEPSDEDVQDKIGLGLENVIRMLFPDQPDNVIHKTVKQYSYNFTNNKEVDFFPNVIETLKKLKKKGHYLCIATGKSRRGLDLDLERVGLTNFFHGSKTADETEPKPSPLMLKELIKEFKISPDKCLMVGDTEFDLQMAHDIGMDRVGVTYGAHNKKQLNNHMPLKLIHDFKELEELV